jgi:hypothetical protein
MPDSQKKYNNTSLNIVFGGLAVMAMLGTALDP